jgi:hypothetical protein
MHQKKDQCKRRLFVERFISEAYGMSAFEKISSIYLQFLTTALPTMLTKQATTLLG